MTRCGSWTLQVDLGGAMMFAARCGWRFWGHHGSAHGDGGIVHRLDLLVDQLGDEGEAPRVHQGDPAVHVEAMEALREEEMEVEALQDRLPAETHGEMVGV